MTLKTNDEILEVLEEIADRNLLEDLRIDSKKYGESMRSPMKCPNCKGKLKDNQDYTSLECDNCKTKFTIQELNRRMNII